MPLAEFTESVPGSIYLWLMDKSAVHHLRKCKLEASAAELHDVPCEGIK